MKLMPQQVTAHAIPHAAAKAMPGPSVLKIRLDIQMKATPMGMNPRNNSTDRMRSFLNDMSLLGFMLH